MVTALATLLQTSESTLPIVSRPLLQQGCTQSDSVSLFRGLRCLGQWPALQQASRRAYLLGAMQKSLYETVMSALHLACNVLVGALDQAIPGLPRYRAARTGFNCLCCRKLMQRRIHAELHMETNTRHVLWWSCIYVYTGCTGLSTVIYHPLSLQHCGSI